MFKLIGQQAKRLYQKHFQFFESWSLDIIVAEW